MSQKHSRHGDMLDVQRQKARNRRSNLLPLREALRDASERRSGNGVMSEM
mgnify:FL=1